MKLGICLEGCEEQFERALRERAKDHQAFVYVEIGTAQADTWLNVCRVLRTTNSFWRTIGIDPSPDALDSYTRKIEPEFNHIEALMLVETREKAFETEIGRIGKWLDFVFLDGCHSKKCVIGDFEAVEPLVVLGGLVVFHDIEDVDGDLQMHCMAPRGVRKGLEELGLWQNTRPGWKRLPDWQCDKTKNAFSCACFEKL